AAAGTVAPARSASGGSARPGDGGTHRRAIEHAAVHVVVSLHIELQLEVGRLAAAPDDERGADAAIGPGLGGDRALVHAPHFGVADPSFERLAIEDGRPSGAVVRRDGFRSDAAAETTRTGRRCSRWRTGGTLDLCGVTGGLR